MGDSCEEKQKECSCSRTVKAVIDADDKGDKCAEEDHFAERECLFFSDERFSEHEVESGTRQDHKDQAFKVVII